MSAVQSARARLTALAERVDRLSLRERGLVFGAAVVVGYVAWQSLVMDPLAARATAAQTRIADASARALQTGAAATDPRLEALERRRAMSDRLAALDRELGGAAGGFVPPDRMIDLLRDVLAQQHGLTLVSLRNLPVESLAAPVADPGTAPAGAPADGAVPPLPAGTPGPFLHPVELVVEGDYAAVVAYLQALERLPLKVQWRRLDLAAGEYPTNRVRIELATLGLGREWIRV
jgi:MSHA biogenesis protein MshJ